MPYIKRGGIVMKKIKNKFCFLAMFLFLLITTVITFLFVQYNALTIRSNQKIVSPVPVINDFQGVANYNTKRKAHSFRCGMDSMYGVIFIL
jgi:hypothetical protein